MRMCVTNKYVFITRPKIQKIYNWLYATVVQRTCDNVPQATGSAGTQHLTLLCAPFCVCLCVCVCVCVCVYVCVCAANMRQRDTSDTNLYW